MTITVSPRNLKVQITVDHPQLRSAELAKILMLPADESLDVGQPYKPIGLVRASGAITNCLEIIFGQTVAGVSVRNKNFLKN